MLSVFVTKCQQTALHRFGLGRSSRGMEIAQVVADARKLTPRSRKASSMQELRTVSRYL